MSFSIKNISRKPLFIFYFQGNLKTRKNLSPGESINSSSVNTNQLNDLKNKGIIQITSLDGQVMSGGNRIITDNAIYPDKKMSNEEYKLSQNMESKVVDLRQLIENNSIDYKKVFEENVSITYNDMELFDVSVIIPVRNREDFAEPLYKSFKAAINKSGLKVDFTFVEHSENPNHSKFCKNNKINYFWLKSAPGELFNKCLAHNVGAIFSSKSKYLLFHDIDCLVQSDFFINLFENIKNQKARAIQNFTKRRVLYINQQLTDKVIAGQFEVDDLSIELDEVNPPQILGAPGGSITIERDLFFEVGGYDPELFLANSPEDAFFWEKVDLIDKMYVSDNPNIEIYHMYHPPTYNDNPLIREMLDIHNTFKSMSKESKREIIELKSKKIKHD